MNQSSQSRWHALPPDAVLRKLESSAQGLNEAEQGRRLARYGPNRFERTPATSPWHILAAQLRNVVVGLLVAAAIVALLSGDPLHGSAQLVV